MHRIVASAVILAICVSTSVAEVVSVEDFQSRSNYQPRWSEHPGWRLMQAEIHSETSTVLDFIRAVDAMPMEEIGRDPLRSAAEPAADRKTLI